MLTLKVPVLIESQQIFQQNTFIKTLIMKQLHILNLSMVFLYMCLPNLLTFWLNIL